MANSVSRRQFVHVTTGGALLTGLGSRWAWSAPPQDATKPPAAKPAVPAFDKGPPLDLELTKQVVGESHRNLEKVMELVTADPELVNAVWDWGGGDFETPLGAAAHTGQREIAEFLLKNGARMDVFAAAMLGKIDVVKAAIAADPMVQFTQGPHGITLVRHAEAGDNEAAAVLAYLKELEASDREARDLPLSRRAIRRYLGRFAAEGGDAVPHEFSESSGRLQWISSGGTVALAHRGNHCFSRTDRPGQTALEFKIRNNQAQTVEIHTGNQTITALRMG